MNDAVIRDVLSELAFDPFNHSEDDVAGVFSSALESSGVLDMTEIGGAGSAETKWPVCTRD